MIVHLIKLAWNRKRANALIVLEILLSFLVVFAVVTGVYSIRSNWARPVGYDWRHVWDVSMEFGIDPRGPEGARLREAVSRMIDEVRTLPEVEAAALGNTPPYAFSTWEGTREINGRQISLIVDDVGDDFDRVMRTKLVAGRWFNREDDAASFQPVVIDTNTAREAFGNVTAVGKVLEEDDRPLRVVGVVEEYRKDGEPSSPVNMVFRRVAMNGAYGSLGSHILVRIRPGTPAEFEERLIQRLRGVAPDIAFRVRHLDQMRTRAIRIQLAPLILGGIVAAFLIAMVALGLTGVLWQNVSRRTRELGVRRALGASGMNVHRQILLEVVVLTTIALSIGAVIVLQLPILGLLSVVSQAAFAVGFAGALATIYMITLVCGLYPSWLASRLTPAEALRYE